MVATILIIGNQGRLRDGLRTILLSLHGIDEVSAVSDFETAVGLITQNFPTAIIVDSSELLNYKCAILKDFLRQNGYKPCIVIAYNHDQWLQAQKTGADAVLMQGFSTTTLQKTLIDLTVLAAPDQQDPRSNSTPITSVQPKQTISPF